MTSATDNRTTELRKLLDERGVKYKSHYLRTSWYAKGKLYMATDDMNGTLTVDNLTPEQAIAATLGSGTKPCYAADGNYKRCKYSVNRGWCDDAPFLVWDDTGHLFITMGGLKTWDVTDDAKKWFAELNSEPPYDMLLHCLENDWNISASWDGLRKFWCIELTEEGVKLRDATHGTLTADDVLNAVYKHGARWQAIADELNARAERTCEDVSIDESQFYCGNCECTVELPLLWRELNYCPNCGCKVVSA